MTLLSRVSRLTETSWVPLFFPSTFSLSPCVCCHLIFSASLLSPQSKRAVCPAMPLALYLFPSESVCCCFSSLFSLLPLSFSLPVPLCKLSLSPTDLGFKAWHETWLVCSLKITLLHSFLSPSLRLHASPITRTWRVHPLSVVQIVVYLVCDVSFFSHTYTEHQK